MPEQPQWPERTLDMPPQDPWADPPTTDMPQRPEERGQSRTYDPTRQWGDQAARPGAPPFQGSARPPQAAPNRPASGPPASSRSASAPPLPGQAPAGHASAGHASAGQAPAGHASAGQAPAGHASAGQAPAGPANPAWSGRAAVNPRPQGRQFEAEHEPTGTGWPGAGSPHERRPLEWHLRQLRRGGEWSFAGLLFAFVCWGIWALSTSGGLTTAVIVFIVSLLAAVGVFALSRLVGRVVLERQFGRERHTAKGSHIVAGIFLVGVGIAHLQQTEWVMSAFNWVVDLFGSAS
jgi:hypothetical protein